MESLERLSETRRPDTNKLIYKPEIDSADTEDKLTVSKGERQGLIN